GVRGGTGADGVVDIDIFSREQLAQVDEPRIHRLALKAQEALDVLDRPSRGHRAVDDLGEVVAGMHSRVVEEGVADRTEGQPDKAEKRGADLIEQTRLRFRQAEQ